MRPFRPHTIHVSIRSIRRPLPRSFSASYCTIKEDSNDLFSYTSGRFVYNERKQLRDRYVEFDISALKEAVTAHTGYGKVTNIAKLGEGGFNRAFLLTLENDAQVVVKTPYHLSAPKKYATASEVATLRFLRSKGIPVPKVYGWSSTDKNAVGTEYIIMEFVSGISLDTKWFDMTKPQQRDLTVEIFEIEKKLMGIPFGSIGSIYFKSDIPPSKQADLYLTGTPDPEEDCREYCIGPIADYMFWQGERSESNTDSGPWNDPHEYLLAIGRREIQWTQQYGKPIEKRFPYNTIPPSEESHHDYLALLNKYLAIAPFLLPTNPRDPNNLPTIRHPDLSPVNIFVSPGDLKITSIIDWQHTVITPLLLAAGHPRLFENPDAEPPESIEEPKPPEGYDALDPAAKSQVDELLRRRHLYYLYRIFNGARNKPHLAACADPFLLPRQHLVDYAGRQWTGNLMTLRGALIRMSQYWPLLQSNGSTCPIEFTEVELQNHFEHEPTWFEYTALVNYWREEMGGMNDEGWVQSEVYDHAVEKNKELKTHFYDGADADEVEKVTLGWPFQDTEESAQ
ncbi:uncharacterized protein GIQ15_03490 [Arthroderma uncinatum]|uniref:uncharacterized protein n=1 Tax=Arthroderma uncinatum TaxID=74035 RepID=UPI00144AC2AD|nr:uncharacterized protein GIQ15_03490 [Arthroderma uncinatum]KAF3484166.1 hypothetical protein GIQ15_03490 [Arthroderma uncinatum]